VKKRILTAGIAALALVFVIGLTGCASVDQQTLKKEGVPQDQRATLYLLMYDNRLEKVDGKKQGVFITLYGVLQGLPGILKKSPGWSEEVTLPGFSVQVSPGEHTLIVSNKAFVGRKSFTGTFNFEAGKKYLVDLTTPSTYEGMMMPGFDGLSQAGNSLAESLANNYIIIIAETTKARPTWRDSTIKSNMWIRSNEAEAAAAN
jgi:hypothetical protein